LAGVFLLWAVGMKLSGFVRFAAMIASFVLMLLSWCLFTLALEQVWVLLVAMGVVGGGHVDQAVLWGEFRDFLLWSLVVLASMVGHLFFSTVFLKLKDAGRSRSDF